MYGIPTDDLSQFYHYEVASHLIMGARLAALMQQVVPDAFISKSVGTSPPPPPPETLPSTDADDDMGACGRNLVVICKG